jgi:deoxyribose-phosphate aldolase
MDNVTALAKMIDHSLLHPTLTEEQLKLGCAVAAQYNVASVCIKPYAVPQAVEWLAGSDVRVGTVIGFPHGSASTAIKVIETEYGCRDGAVEVDMVVNIGQVLGEDWAYVESEIAAVLATTRHYNAILKVIFENDFLPKDEYKIRLCEICSRVGVAFVKTSTGYGFVQGPDRRYGYQGATDHDLILMRTHSDPRVQVKAAGGIRTLDDVLHVQRLGVTRVGATATAAILEEARRRYGLPPMAEAFSVNASGY